MNWHCRKLCWRFRKINISIPKIQSANQPGPFYHHSPSSCVFCPKVTKCLQQLQAALSKPTHEGERRITTKKEKPKHEAFCQRFYEAVTSRIPSSFSYNLWNSQAGNLGAWWKDKCNQCLISSSYLNFVIQLSLQLFWQDGFLFWESICLSGKLILGKPTSLLHSLSSNLW